MAEHQVPPIDTLPRDILIEIFSRAQCDPIYFGYPDIPIWRISLVCASWHEIAFNTPHLWATIQLSPRELSPDTTRVHNMIKSWKSLLGRSEPCSLDLRLGSSLEDTQVLQLLLITCLEHANRWKSIMFSFPLDVLMPFMSNPNISYPRLRSVSLPLHMFYEAFTKVQKLDLFKNAPLLRTISVYNLRIPIEELKFPWTQITHYKVHQSFPKSNAGDVAAISKLMPNLVSLDISGRTMTSNNGPLLPYNELAYLRKLKLQGTPVHQFFDSLSAPRLKELEILRADHDDWFPPVERFLLRSGCPVISVILGPSVPFTTSFLTYLPHLESLCLLPPPGDKEVLRELTINDSQSPPLCPELKRIILPNIYVSNGWWEDLAIMLESRLCLSDNSRDDRCKLESLHIITWISNEGVPEVPLDLKSFRALKEHLLLRYKIRITCEDVLLSSYPYSLVQRDT